MAPVTFPNFQILTGVKGQDVSRMIYNDNSWFGHIAWAATVSTFPVSKVLRFGLLRLPASAFYLSLCILSVVVINQITKVGLGQWDE